MSETQQEQNRIRASEARWTAVIRVLPQGEENLRWVHLSYALQAKEWREIVAAARKGGGLAPAGQSS